MRAISILEWILRIAGLGALVLGLLIWTLQLDSAITIICSLAWQWPSRF